MCGEGAAPGGPPRVGSHLGVLLGVWRSGAHPAPRPAPHSPSGRTRAGLWVPAPAPRGRPSAGGVPAAIAAGWPRSPRPGGRCWAVARRRPGLVRVQEPGNPSDGSSERSRQAPGSPCSPPRHAPCSGPPCPGTRGYHPGTCGCHPARGSQPWAGAAWPGQGPARAASPSAAGGRVPPPTLADGDQACGCAGGTRQGGLGGAAALLAHAPQRGAGD